MKKSILIIMIVLILTTALLVGCAAYPESQEGYQRGNGNNATEQNVEAGIGYGNGNGQRVGDGDAYCGAETDVSSVIPEQETGGPVYWRIRTALGRPGPLPMRT